MVRRHQGRWPEPGPRNKLWKLCSKRAHTADPMSTWSHRAVRSNTTPRKLELGQRTRTFTTTHLRCHGPPRAQRGGWSVGSPAARSVPRAVDRPPRGASRARNAKGRAGTSTTFLRTAAIARLLGSEKTTVHLHGPGRHTWVALAFASVACQPSERRLALDSLLHCPRKQLFIPPSASATAVWSPAPAHEPPTLHGTRGALLNAVRPCCSEIVGVQLQSLRNWTVST